MLLPSVAKLFYMPHHQKTFTSPTMLQHRFRYWKILCKCKANILQADRLQECASSHQFSLNASIWNNLLDEAHHCSELLLHPEYRICRQWKRERERDLIERGNSLTSSPFISVNKWDFKKQPKKPSSMCETITVLLVGIPKEIQEVLRGYKNLWNQSKQKSYVFGIWYPEWFGLAAKDYECSLWFKLCWQHYNAGGDVRCSEAKCAPHKIHICRLVFISFD